MGDNSGGRGHNWNDDNVSGAGGVPASNHNQPWDTEPGTHIDR